MEPIQDVVKLSDGSEWSFLAMPSVLIDWPRPGRGNRRVWIVMLTEEDADEVRHTVHTLSDAVDPGPFLTRWAHAHLTSTVLGKDPLS